ncbi:MAG: cupin [Gammaproteobacteria bacterium]|nr:cupin [Gammaproteobacteria bacterium]
MTAMTVYSEAAEKQTDVITDFSVIESELKAIGVQFERWQANQPLAVNADQQAVLDAYRSSVDKLNTQYGFKSVDVVSLGPDHPDKEMMRNKFLAEHTHGDFEIRFFVDGKGLFYLHANGKVFLVMCEKGDLISVPANTTHWFDMGEHPSFKCIRFFTTENGWEGHMTGSKIASQFPDFDEYSSAL